MLQRLILLLVISCPLLFGAGSGIAQEKQLPVATGEHWTTATEREKKAFLLGMGTIIEIEQEIQGDNPPPADKSFIPTMVKGLDPYSITTAMQAIDAWYAANTDQLKRPVIEVVWFELVLPNAVN